jgi:NAD(P)-dependent dehydrogenase (short-subunit alcohol dehydrogenase family)
LLLPDHIQRGCTSIAIVDLKSSEATQAAEELTEYGTCQYIENQSFSLRFLSEKRFTVAQCNLENVQIIGIECDVAEEASVQHAYEVIIATFGRIDAVVASAGILFNFSSDPHLIF